MTNRYVYIIFLKITIKFGEKNHLSAFKGIQIKTLIRSNHLSMKLAKKNT